MVLSELNFALPNAGLPGEWEQGSPRAETVTREEARQETEPKAKAERPSAREERRRKSSPVGEEKASFGQGGAASAQEKRPRHRMSPEARRQAEEHRRITHRQKLPREIARLVEAVCGDYDRREKELARGGVRVEAQRKYRYLNDTIRKALAGFGTEEEIRVLLIDIADRRSRLRSPQYRLHPTTYAELKRKAKFAIARQLRLI